MDALSLDQTAEIVEMSEANMYRTIFDAAPPDFAAKHGISWREVGGATALTLKALPTAALLNRVIGLGIREPATEAMIAELIEQHTRDKTVLCISVGPSAKPAQLPDWLKARGFVHTSNLAKMIRGTEPAPQVETDLRIEPVDETTTAQFGTVVQVAFGMPAWTAEWFAYWTEHPDVYGFLAYDGDEPVGGGALVVSGEWGSLGAGGTLPDYRRRGSQSAIFARRIQKGIEMGCRWLTTETGESTPERPNPSYNNMVRTGFKLAYLQSWYVYTPETMKEASG